ncbi:Protein deglycase DJ-1zDJ-1 [Podila verticillata]|nr:Protein deglycase DJ-1zDJ-1 [Podila verticillata]
MSDSKKKTALVLIADGTEEMEAVITIDVLVRAGLDVTVASIKPEASVQPVKCSRGVKIVPDTLLSSLPMPTITDDELSPKVFNVLVIPGGGPGAQAMVASPLVHEWVQSHYKKSLLAAVCAGPTVLKASNVAKGAKVTSHPSVRSELEGYFAYQDNYIGKSIVVQDKDHRLITSRGPGSTFEFALAIVEQLQGAKTADEIRGPMMFPQ